MSLSFLKVQKCGTARRLLGKTLDVLLPARCPSCDALVEVQGGLCGSCWQKTVFFEKPWCYRLGTPFSYDIGEDAWSPRAIAAPPAFDRLRSVAAHEGIARRLVHGLKFARRRELAKTMGSWMARAGVELLAEGTVLVPVPLHWVRLAERRFNQAADLANVIATETGCQFEPSVLKRRKRTRNQVGLSAEERQKNVRGAFHIAQNSQLRIAGRSVVLVDDVITTGSTVTACTRLLLGAGASSVDVLTFSHADATTASAGSDEPV